MNGKPPLPAKHKVDEPSKDGGNQILDWLYSISVEYFVNWRKHFKEYAFVILLMLAFRSCVGVVYRIPSGSMIPTFREGDTLIANRFYYGLKLPFTDGLNGFRLPAIREIEPGDIIIFRAPPEEVFYDVAVQLQRKDRELIKEINEESAFKRPISMVGKNSILFPYLGRINYIASDTAGDAVMLHLHEKVWKKYSDQLEDLGIISKTTGISILNYQNSQYEGFVYELLKTPISGLSIMAEGLLNLTFFWPQRALLAAMMPQQFSGNQVNVFPNRFVDTTKEFVKRVIAVEGDIVEIKKRRVWINGKMLKHSKDFVVDPYDDYFKIGEEAMPNSPKKTNDGKDGVFLHPIRLGKDTISPFLRFDEKQWPFEPNSFSAINFRDDFGPVKVKEGHFFVMGDNRDESQDSRFIGFVPKWAIKGTPMYIFFPFSRMGLVK